VAHSQTAEPTRRDFLFIATAAAGAVGAGSVLIPLVDQMNPAADVLALASIEIDLAPIQPGQSVTFTWRSHPLFVRRRTNGEIAMANAVKPAVLPGEDLRVRVIQEGKEAGQGVGFLDDGTMIVVEGGARHIDKELDVSVTRVLQTVAGRMIFAQPRLD